MLFLFDLTFLLGLSQRLSIAKEFGDKAAERRAYSNLGNALIFLGQFNTATEYYRWGKRGVWHLVEWRWSDPISARVKKWQIQIIWYKLNMKKKQQFSWCSRVELKYEKKYCKTIFFLFSFTPQTVIHLSTHSPFFLSSFVTLYIFSVSFPNRIPLFLFL